MYVHLNLNETKDLPYTYAHIQQITRQMHSIEGEGEPCTALQALQVHFLWQQCWSKLDTTVRGLCFSYGQQLYCDESHSAPDHYDWARALGTLLLLQAAPLKCDVGQTQHRMPDSWASPCRHINEMTCTQHCGMLTKQYAQHCTQNCSGQAHQKFTRYT